MSKADEDKLLCFLFQVVLGVRDSVETAQHPDWLAESSFGYRQEEENH